MARPMKNCGGQNQDGGINEQGKHEREGRIDSRKLDRLASAVGRLFEFARLHDG